MPSPAAGHAPSRDWKPIIHPRVPSEPLSSVWPRGRHSAHTPKAGLQLCAPVLRVHPAVQTLQLKKQQHLRGAGEAPETVQTPSLGGTSGYFPLSLGITKEAVSGYGAAELIKNDKACNLPAINEFPASSFSPLPSLVLSGLEVTTQTWRRGRVERN